MKLLFVKSNRIGSVLIRWGLEEQASHFAVEFDDKLIFHAKGSGVLLESSKGFRSHYKIVKEIDLSHWSLAKQETVYQSMIQDLGRPYDYMAMLYFIYRGFLFKFLRKPMPKRNKWGSKRGYLCTEVAKKLPWSLLAPKLDLEMVSPMRLYGLIMERLGEDV